MTTPIPTTAPLHPYRTISAVPASGQVGMVGVGTTAADPASASSSVGKALLWTFGVGALAVIGYNLMTRAPAPEPVSMRPTRRGRRSNPAEDVVPEMVLCVYADGAVWGASRSGHAWNPRFWLPLRLEHEPYDLYELHNVPEDIARKLEGHGVSGEQWYDDGYKAMRAAQPYMPAEPFYTYGG